MVPTSLSCYKLLNFDLYFLMKFFRNSCVSQSQSFVCEVKKKRSQMFFYFAFLILRLPDVLLIGLNMVSGSDFINSCLTGVILRYI